MILLFLPSKYLRIQQDFARQKKNSPFCLARRGAG
jgi:hypothetical protein